MYLLLLFACAPKGEVDTGDPPDLATTTPPACDTVPPVIESLTASNGGIIDDPDGGTQPSIRIAADISDEDGNIDTFRAQFWSAAGTDPPSLAGTPAEFTHAYEGATECHLFSGGFSVNFGVTDTDYGFNTVWTFAMVALDHDGRTSEPAYVTGTTPMEDGTDGTAVP